MSLERAQLEYDLREPKCDPVRESLDDRIMLALLDLNDLVEQRCDLDGVCCDRVSVNEFFCLAVGMNYVNC